MIIALHLTSLATLLVYGLYSIGVGVLVFPYGFASVLYR